MNDECKKCKNISDGVYLCCFYMNENMYLACDHMQSKNLVEYCNEIGWQDTEIIILNDDWIKNLNLKIKEK